MVYLLYLPQLLELVSNGKTKKGDIDNKKIIKQPENEWYIIPVGSPGPKGMVIVSRSQFFS